MSAISLRKDLRGGFGPARDQGERPTCLVFAASDTHAAVRGPWQELSCEYLFYHAKRREKAAPSSGANPLFVQQALEHDGQPVESDWKYLATLPTDLKLWAPPDKVGPVFRRASTLLAGGFDEGWAAVEVGTPVLILTTISDGFYTPDLDGVVHSAEAPDPARRHAVVGVASGERAGMRYLLVRNSWGETWGLQGHAWLAEPYLSPRISRMYTMN